MNRTRTGLVAVALAASVSLTACGGSTDNAPGSSSDQASDSASPSAAANAAYTPLTKAGWADALVKATSKDQNSHIEMKMGTAMKASGDMSLVDRKPVMKMTMKMTLQGNAMDMEARVVDGTMYVSTTGGLAGGKWIKIDTDAPRVGQIARMLKNFNPASMVALSTDAIEKLKYTGEDTIDGEPVHTYTLTANMSKAASKLGLPGIASRVGSSKSDSSVPTSITEKIFLNKDNTVRRITSTLSGQEVQIDRTDASGPVKVSAPPASDVVDMSDLLSKVQSDLQSDNAG